LGNRFQNRSRYQSTKENQAEKNQAEAEENQAEDQAEGGGGLGA